MLTRPDVVLNLKYPSITEVRADSYFTIIIDTIRFYLEFDFTNIKN